MSQAIYRLDSLVYQGYDVGATGFHVIIPLIGHFSAYIHTDEEDGSRAAYWAAAQASAPDMAVIEEQLADPDGIHDWELRLGAVGDARTVGEWPRARERASEGSWRRNVRHQWRTPAHCP